MTWKQRYDRMKQRLNPYSAGSETVAIRVALLYENRPGVLILILLEVRLLQSINTGTRETTFGLNPYSAGSETVAIAKQVRHPSRNPSLNPYSAGSETVALSAFFDHNGGYVLILILLEVRLLLAFTMNKKREERASLNPYSAGSETVACNIFRRKYL